MDGHPEIDSRLPIDSSRWSAPEPPPVLRPGRRLPPAVNLVCFVLTVVTTLIAGSLLTLGDLSKRTVIDVILTPSLWTLGLSYSLALILILGAHEMGHYIACRRYGIDATLPFFIPGPTIIGTFGAVIRIRAPFTSRRSLFDVGVAGPIAGFLVAVPVLAWGLQHSQVVPLTPPRPDDIAFPPCLLLSLAYRLFFPRLTVTQTVALHPVVVAAWVGCLATFLNLLPIGQLDGGHMLYALSRRAHRPVSLATIALMVAAGILFGGLHLIVFGAVWAMVGPGHPPVPDHTEPPGAWRIAVTVIAALIFVLTLIPTSPRIFAAPARPISRRWRRRQPPRDRCGGSRHRQVAIDSPPPDRDAPTGFPLRTRSPRDRGARARGTAPSWRSDCRDDRPSADRHRAPGPVR